MLPVIGSDPIGPAHPVPPAIRASPVRIGMPPRVRTHREHGVDTKTQPCFAAVDQVIPEGYQQLGLWVRR
jgi:hypothetical protein